MIGAVKLCFSIDPTSQSRIGGSKTVNSNKPFLFIIGFSEVLVTVLKSYLVYFPTEIRTRHQEWVDSRIDAGTQVS